jgi:glycosyltransferase involved in cell wall biosynthesis
MRIGMPTTSYPRDANDAGGSFVRALARALVRRGHTVEVLAPELPGSLGDPEDPGIDVRRIAYLRPRALERTFGLHGAPDNLRLDLLAWPGAVAFPIALALACRKRRLAWDAIVSHWAIPSALAVGSRSPARPHVAVLHGSDAHLALRMPRPVRDAIAASASTLAFVSTDLRDRFVDVTRAHEHVVVQPMGIDTHETRGRDRERARARHRFSRRTVLAMSRLVPIKGLDRAIDAVSQLDDVELVIAGEGPERAELERRARQRRAPVRFLGQLMGDARLDALAGADLFVAPARSIGGRSEGTPTAILEALAAGLPVVASDVGGIGEVVAHEQTGLLSSGEPRELARDLERLANDAAARDVMSANAIASARAFDVDGVAERFERWLARPQGSIDTAPGGTSSANAASGMLAG